MNCRYDFFSMEERVCQVQGMASRENLSLREITLSQDHFEKLKKELGSRAETLPDGIMYKGPYGYLVIKSEKHSERRGKRTELTVNESQAWGGTRARSQ